MLSILLPVAVLLQVSSPAGPTAPSITVVTVPVDVRSTARMNGAPMPVLGDGGLLCENRTTQANDVTVAGDLTWRSGDQAVGLYRLLDRRVDGCPAPILVNERVPGSNAVGREMGRDTAPAAVPVIVRRP